MVCFGSLETSPESGNPATVDWTFYKPGPIVLELFLRIQQSDMAPKKMKTKASGWYPK